MTHKFIKLPHPFHEINYECDALYMYVISYNTIQYYEHAGGRQLPKESLFEILLGMYTRLKKCERCLLPEVS